jgi:hypothetical protein
MSPRIGPYSPLAAILAKADRGYLRAQAACRGSVRLSWPSPMPGVWFPHLMTASPPDSVADGTPNGTQKALTLPVGRPSVFSGDWPRSR